MGLAFRLHAGLLPVVFLLVDPSVAKAVPRIDNLSVRGLQAGGVTTVTITGSDLLPEPRVLPPMPVAAQTLKPGATPKRIELELKVPADARLGFYPFRVASVYGISNPLLMAIDQLPQLPFTPQLDQLPAALHGQLSGSESAITTFQGTKGQRIVVEVEAKRLGSDIDPLLELQDARGVPIASAQSRATLGDDSRLEAVLPADGRYAVALRDLLYRAGTSSQFRLKIGELHYADLTFPLGLQRGKQAKVQLLGNLGDEREAAIDATAATEDLAAPLPHVPGMTGSPPTVFIGDLPDVLEEPAPAGKLQEVMVPASIHGRLAKPHEEDRYRLRVKPGMQLRIEVLAQRAGSPLDGVLTLRNEAGAQLATSDDQADSVDPSLSYTVPDKVQAVVVALSDLHGRGGENFIYRLSVATANPQDFRLTIFEDRYQLPQGGTIALRIRAERAGYNGPIHLKLPELPPGITVSGDVIPAGATDTLLTLTAPAPRTGPPVVGTIIGESATSNPRIRRTALLRETPFTRHRPWLRDSVAFALTEPQHFRIDWDQTAAELLLGLTYNANVKVVRPAGKDGPVRLAVLTSQVVPRTRDGKQDDATRALRLERPQTLAAGKSQIAAPIVVPADLPPRPYDLVVTAELLSADGKQVLASTVTLSRRLPAVTPLTLQVTDSPSVEVRSGGQAAKLRGKVVRAASFDRPATVTLTGLPGKVPSPKVEVAPGRSDFELPISIPAGTPIGELANVKMAASGTTASGQSFTSIAVPVKIRVTPGEALLTKSLWETDPKGWIDLLSYDHMQHWKRTPIPPGSALAPKNPWSIHLGEATPTLACDGAGVHEMLLYDRDWSDGVYHLEWRFQPDSRGSYNSGAYVRTSTDGKIWHQAQISDKVGFLFGETLTSGKPQSVNIPSQVLPRGKPAGEWNVFEITCKGKTVTLWVNGAVTAVWNACDVAKGRVGLEAEGSVIEFRNVKFKELR